MSDKKDIAFALQYRGYAVFIDYAQHTLFAVPVDKIEPDSGLTDEEIILAPTFRHIKLIVDSRDGGPVPLKRCAQCANRALGTGDGHCYMFQVEPEGEHCGQFKLTAAGPSPG